MYNIKDKNADSGGKQTTFPSISSLIGHAFSIFRQKMDSLNPSDMDIKVFFPAPTFYLQLKNIFHKQEKEKCFLGWKNEIKIKNTDCMTSNIIANVNNHHPHVHFIINNGSLDLTLWKWGETSSTTSLLLIRTSSN